MVMYHHYLSPISSTHPMSAHVMNPQNIEVPSSTQILTVCFKGSPVKSMGGVSGQERRLSEVSSDVLILRGEHINTTESIGGRIAYIAVVGL